VSTALSIELARVDNAPQVAAPLDSNGKDVSAGIDVYSRTRDAQATCGVTVFCIYLSF
jgi:hypothetical protein